MGRGYPPELKEVSPVSKPSSIEWGIPFPVPEKPAVQWMKVDASLAVFFASEVFFNSRKETTPLVLTPILPKGDFCLLVKVKQVKQIRAGLIASIGTYGVLSSELLTANVKRDK